MSEDGKQAITPTVVESGLDESADLVRLFLDSTGEGIYGVDLEGNCTFANPACVRLLGFDDASELVGQHMHTLVHHTRANGQPYPVDECRIYQAFAERRGVHVDDEVMFRKDGTRFRCEYWSYPVERDGELIGSVLTFVDISDRVEVESALAEAMRDAQAAVRAKNQFMANMSHELRTPMNAILGYSEILIEDAEDAGLDEMVVDLKRIAAAGHHLLSLIDDVLDLSKLEGGRMDFFLETFDVSELIAEVVRVAQPLVEGKGSELIVESADDLGQMHADLTKVRQSLVNLLSNAAKFTDAGRVTLRSSRLAQPEGDRLRFAVTDTGIGIRHSKLDAVFEDFSQADGSSTRSRGGTGLGLPLTRRLCRMMGGDVLVESIVDVGSTFTIDLPAVVAEPADESSPELTGHLVLLVGGEDHARSRLRRTIETGGCDVAEAGTGVEGLDRVRQHVPDLILLDPLMPVMDGFEFLERLRSSEASKLVPVVAMAGPSFTAADRERIGGQVVGIIDGESSPEQITEHVFQLLATGD